MSVFIRLCTRMKRLKQQKDKGNISIRDTNPKKTQHSIVRPFILVQFVKTTTNLNLPVGNVYFS